MPQTPLPNPCPPNTTPQTLSHQAPYQVIRIKETLTGVVKIKEDIKRRRAAVKPTMDDYAPLAKQGARLLNAAGGIRLLDTTYQLPMERFLKLIRRAFEENPKNMFNTKERVVEVSNALSLSLYSHVAQGLLPHHRPVWLLSLSLHIDQAKGDVSAADIKFLATAGAGAGPRDWGNPQLLERFTDAAELERWRNQVPWLSTDAFNAALHLMCCVETFRNWRGDDVFNTLQIHDVAFKRWLALPDPEEYPVPGYESSGASASATGVEAIGSVTPCMRLLLIRALRTDRFVHASRHYARAVLGSRFLDPVRANIESAYRHSDPHTPILLVASEPCDALAVIQAAAEHKSVSIKAVPLGEGQKELAQKLLISAPSAGAWVVLQNGHLDPPFIASLPHYLQKLDHANERFRLFITTIPGMVIPFTVASISVRQVMEQPRGLKASLLQTFRLMPASHVEAVQEPEWLMLLFATSFMHALSVARLSYGPAGWSVPYNMPMGDLRASLCYLEQALNSAESRTQTGRLAIHWQTIQQVLSKSLVGLSASDPYDALVIDTLMNRYIATRVLNPENELAPGYTAPASNGLLAIIRHVADLPEWENASLYGLTAGTDERRNRIESASLASFFASTVIPEPHRHPQTLNPRNVKP